MEQRQLEYFVAVAEELNFTRAAQRTHAVQSTVSASVRALERHLGAPLFDRSTTRVALTAAGKALLPEARRALDALDQARATVTGLRAGLTGSLRVGTLSGLTAIDLPALVSDFRTRHPGVRLSLSMAAGGTDGLLAAVRARDLDVAFVGVQTASVPDLQLDPIATFQPRVLVPAGHPLAGAGTVTPAGLADEPFIDLPPGFCNRIRTDHDFRRAGIARTIAVEVSDITTIPGYVEAGIGVALVPPLAAEVGRRVAAIDLDPPAAPWTLAAASLGNPTATPALRAFLDLVAAHVVRRDRY
ncbi:LysR family transcriptional regulator [Actinoplanes sp. SE50]|uniref:LysR family transcriptional regulator n=1 Tax=unclassified Actinoplanes TaxID=2626549 RepID=UPI00023ED26E|nr:MULTISPECIES: LysR family transcriptional regulator [unclassified Actinoplanes]AEV85566.1 putative RuBisCO transcriptional regulator [Actinoplanes sp. SE50/110]ATO83959.1 LysR family transcriptional regulator [Actinoplanes sp. SE50]SLM01369.1 LysR-family transcriptional regulator [Actinoplanes sp. SE50/110]